VRRYIEQSVEQPAIREIAPRVLKELVSEQGTKRPRSEQELIQETRLRPGEVRAVMNGLSAAALARPLDSAQGVWELSHDFVARAVARYLGRRRVDWPTLARAFAAPALFGLMTAAVAGAVIWNASTAERLRAQLADFGIEVSQDEREASVGPRFKEENWVQASSLLARLTTLEQLDLSNTQVADFAPLKGLTALQSLDLGFTEVTNLAPLKGLTALQSLNLSNTEVADLVPLKSLTTLQSLDLTGTNVADLAPLNGLTALQSLHLAGTNVADLSPLNRLTALWSLDLSNTTLADLGSLKSLTVQSLNLNGAQVADLAPLNGLTALQSLNLSNTKVTDLAPLKDLTALRWLDLSGVPAAGLTPVRDLPNLTRITGPSDAKLQELNTYRSQNKLPFLGPASRKVMIPVR
jgi:Leucine Rich repeats (2 copies)